MTDWLWELLSDVWRTKQVPQELKNAILIPLHKKQSRKVCENFVVLLCSEFHGKVLSLILLNRLQAIMEPQLPKSQCRSKGPINY